MFFEFILGVLSVLDESECVWDFLGVFESVGGVLSACGYVSGVFCGDVHVLDALSVF